MSKKNTKQETAFNEHIYWIGYAWFLGPKVSRLTVSYKEETDDAEKQDSDDDENTLRLFSSRNQRNNYTKMILEWPSKITPSSPPDPGIVNTMGIAGIGGYLLDAQSKLSRQENEWKKQVCLIEDRFERMLADSLIAVINEIREKHEHDAESKGKTTKKIRIILQGPAFPKLLGRLSYRNIRDDNDHIQITFMTFRRRFLTPSPLLQYEERKADSPGLIYGPVPSFHEEAIVRKFYVLFSRNDENAHKGYPSSDGAYCPLMIEMFEQNIRNEADTAELARLLEYLGVKQNQGDIYIHKDSKSWCHYPHDKAFQKVLMPNSLHDVHFHSLTVLKDANGIASSQDEAMDLYNRIFELVPLVERKEAARNEREIVSLIKNALDKNPLF